MLVGKETGDKKEIKKKEGRKKKEVQTKGGKKERWRKEGGGGGKRKREKRIKGTFFKNENLKELKNWVEKLILKYVLG